MSSASRTIWSVPAPVVMSLGVLDRLAAGVADHGDGLGGALEVVHDDPGPAPRQEQRVLAPETVVRACDRHHPVVEAQLVHGRILADRKGAWRRESSTGGW